MFLFKVAEPNEALIISGMRAHRGAEGDAAGLGFKIVVGKGAFYAPGLQKVRHLSLDIHEAELDLECVTTQGIRVKVKSVVICNWSGLGQPSRGAGVVVAGWASGFAGGG